MADPYNVLGVSRTASMEDVKKAYRKLSRKYHPDANVNNPNKDQAEERFKQIQEAYNQIVAEKERGQSAYGGWGGTQSQNAYGSDETDLKMRAAVNYINNMHYREAVNVLDQMGERTADWYYLHGVAHAGMGSNVQALQDAEKAVAMAPDNMRYKAFLNQLQSGGQWYQNMGDSYGYERPGESMGSCCWKCLCLNTVCNCCLCRPGC